jgi:hypothetical protein
MRKKMEKKCTVVSTLIFPLHQSSSDANAPLSKEKSHQLGMLFSLGPVTASLSLSLSLSLSPSLSLSLSLSLFLHVTYM